MYKAGLIFLFVLFFGVAGFMFLVDYKLVDALYMTVITMSTVGFREVVALDTTGKIFTIFLIIFSVGAYAYLVAAVANYIANDRSFDELKKKEINDKMGGSDLGFKNWRNFHKENKNILINNLR